MGNNRKGRGRQRGGPDARQHSTLANIPEPARPLPPRPPPLNFQPPHQSAGYPAAYSPTGHSTAFSPTGPPPYPIGGDPSGAAQAPGNYSHSFHGAAQAPSPPPPGLDYYAPPLAFPPPPAYPPPVAYPPPPGADSYHGGQGYRDNDSYRRDGDYYRQNDNAYRQNDEMARNRNSNRRNDEMSRNRDSYRSGNDFHRPDRRNSRDDGNRRNDDNYRNGNHRRNDSNYRNDANRRDGNDYRNDNSRRDGNSRHGNDTGSYRPPAADTYRPPQAEFTFQQSAPPGLDFGASNQQNGNQQSGGRRDRGPPRGRDRGAQRGSRSQFGGRPGGFRPSYPAKRELLTATHTTGNEQILYGADNGVTYRPLDELTDSDEAEMEESGAENGEPSTKRARVAGSQAEGDSEPKFAPRWCNPDPYTALPAVDTTTAGKKKDVVQLIRKARVQTGESRPSLPTTVEEFISFDGDSSEEEDDEPSGSGVNLAAPPPTAPVPGAPIPVAPIPVVTAQAALGPSYSNNIPVPQERNLALGSRKRTHNDVIKQPDTRLTNPPTVKQLGVVSYWAAKPGEDPVPWYAFHHELETNRERLHQEIMDFYDFVRPQPFEETIRTKLINDMKSVIRKHWGAGDAEVYAFGSFPTGLYLPTSDMDMVLCSDGHLNEGRPPKYALGNFGKLRRFMNVLADHGFVKGFSQDCTQIIAKAKVPIVKFVERKTLLKVDISFENTNGLAAINTFNEWRQEYPMMPIFVTLLKHLLCMYGLNEPASGGIGGLSTTCLVVSMMQTHKRQDGTLYAESEDLGELLLGFTDLYGNQFDYHRYAISVNPPAIIEKSSVQSVVYKNLSRFSILDPNNPSNDIAGGAKMTQMIVELFRQIHATLVEKIKSKEEGELGSILLPFMGGDYSSFRNQRAHLAKLAGLNPRTAF
ncbi:hypothetical protein OQA88_12544 [Cercophora sp. LCS_1]